MGLMLKRYFVAAALAGAFFPGHAMAAPADPAKAAPSAADVREAALVAAITKLTQSNQDLLDLLKKQQEVLEDIQYDRRLQNRQVASLEERLEETMQENSKLESKVARLEAQIAVTPLPSAPATPPAKTDEEPPPAPAGPQSYLQPAQTDAEPGTKWWHRLFTLTGTDNKTTDSFRIQGHQWRVLWHNQDKPGPTYANTSALFINAVPRDDVVPQKVCSKLGSGGDITELNGPGTYSLKVEASGGSWEMAVEEFR